MEEGLTLYKLIILYMLRKVNFPLSGTQITEFIVGMKYTDFFHVQEALNDLLSTKLIVAEKIRNMTRYMETMDGERTLEYFSCDIPPAIKKEIDKYLKDNAFELRYENSNVADFKENGDHNYEVDLRVVDGNETVFGLTFSVATEEEASRICSKWPFHSQELYLDVMTKLL